MPNNPYAPTPDYRPSRERKELDNLFKDPRFSRKAWQAVGHALLKQPATRPIEIIGKDGMPTLESDEMRYTYEMLHNDLWMAGREQREPTQLEMILGCQILRARHDTAAATFVRDTVGAKPIDESKVDQTVFNEYAGLTDEELEMLAAMRAARRVTAPSEEPPATPQSHLVDQGATPSQLSAWQDRSIEATEPATITSTNLKEE